MIFNEIFELKKFVLIKYWIFDKIWNIFDMRLKKS